MTPRSLFNIILKIFGLFFLKEIVFIIPQLISSFSYLTKSDLTGSAQFSNDGIFIVILTLVSIVLYFFIIYQLLFKSNVIIDKLKLDQGFNQEEFSFNISTSMVLTIALVVIGCVVLTNEIPNLSKNIFSYFQEKSLTRGMTKPNFTYIITSTVKIIVGLLLIGERKRIVAFVDKRQTKEQTDESD